MRVGVAIVAYNRLECLQRCLDSIFRSNSVPLIDSLAVFDDGSPYSLSAEIDFPEGLSSRVFQSSVNHGVIVNKNRALYYFAEVDPVDIVIILEDDVVVSSSDWISPWIDSVNLHGHMNYSPGYFRIPAYEKYWLRPDSKGTPEDPFSYSVVTGQCTALRVELIRSKVGYLNPQFQGYGHGHVSDSLEETYKYHPTPKEQADSMGILLVQTYDGRIEPTHTLAYDIFHKISKENDFTTSDNISVNPMQIFIDMILDKPYWLEEKIIYIKKGTGVADSLGIEGKYASVKDFFNPDGTEKLKELVQSSFAKKDVEKNVFDKEVIKANERMNIVLQTMNGAFLKIFPIAGSIDNKWVDWMDPYAEQPIDTTDQHLANISLSRLFRSYIIDLGEAKKTNNYETAQSLLNFIKAYQIKTAPAKLLLNKNQIEREISYNHSNLFVTVKNYYGYLSVLLLIFSFWNALSKKKNLINKIVKYILWVLIVLLMVVFGMHTYALALRWYITEHAPWSNGYEALTFIAWGGVLAGFLFIRSSRITLAGTALLAFCVLMTAGHSSFDPQLTDLQPVLKSYWLVIHVACITISYGFLGLGFILGLINVVNYIFLKPKNKNLKMIISELTYVNEMTLTIGLALATIGTFLGGIWANESWGRYWGWDAKETWALVIVLTYAIILHFRLIPGLKSKFTFNVASVLAFSSVLMTFIGVNYYLSKGLHSYARGETPVFPMWAWITIASIFGLILMGWYNKKKLNKST